MKISNSKKEEDFTTQSYLELVSQNLLVSLSYQSLMALVVLKTALQRKLSSAYIISEILRTKIKGPSDNLSVFSVKVPLIQLTHQPVLYLSLFSKDYNHPVT